MGAAEAELVAVARWTEGRWVLVSARPRVIAGSRSGGELDLAASDPDAAEDPEDEPQAQEVHP